MRTSTIARGGALLTAAAVAITLGSGPASASGSDDQAARVGSQSTASAHRVGVPFAAPIAKVTTPATITKFTMKSGVLAKSGLNPFCGTVTGVNGSGSAITKVQTTVRINGHYKGRTNLYLGDASPSCVGGVDLVNTVGAGKVQLGPTRITYADATVSVDATKSNVFYARRLVTSKATYPLTIHRVSKKITFTVHGVKIFVPSTGKFKTLKKIKLQYKKGSHWKTKKTIKLNSKGNGSYKIKTSTKRSYRIYSATTSTASKFYTIKGSKI